MPNNVLVLDAGNARIKGKTAGREADYPHAIRELSEADYRRVIERGGLDGPGLDYLRINGKPYVVGEAAERHGTLTRRTGAARYTGDYYGVFVAATLARVYERGGDIMLFGSHPPGDVVYRDELMGAALGTWVVELAAGGGAEFRVTYANTFDEPVGGLMNVILAPDGRHYARTDINGGRALVIDIGGHTTDMIAVNPGGVVDPEFHSSTPLGILQAIRDFERSFRDKFKTATRQAATLPINRIREALTTGKYKGGGGVYPCQQEADEATSQLINRIADVYQQIAGGPMPWDSIILTGGGAGMLHDRLLPVLAHHNVILADDPDQIHLANVRGGLKLWRLLDSLGGL